MYNNLRNKIVGYLACVHFISIIVKCFFLSILILTFLCRMYYDFLNIDPGWL